MNRNTSFIVRMEKYKNKLVIFLFPKITSFLIEMKLFFLRNVNENIVKKRGEANVY